MNGSSRIFPVDADGVWVEITGFPPADGPRPALFLDRDGVIVEDTGYLRRESDVRLIDGASAMVARANRCRVPVVIVTNQSGIGRGLFDWATFARVQARIVALLANDGARIDAVIACPHHPLAAPRYAHPDAPWRKPNPGMLLKAATLLPIDLEISWMVGDRAIDLLAARRAGLAGGVHVSSNDVWSGDECRQAVALDNDHFRAIAVRSVGDVLDQVPFLRIP